MAPLPEIPPRVYVVLQGPDLTYYGGAEIHGVYASKDAAEAKAREVDPTWKGSYYEPLGVHECEVEA